MVVKMKIALPTEIAKLFSEVTPLRNIYQLRSTSLPNKPSVYCFWWIGSYAKINSANKFIRVKGPKEKLVVIEYKFWHPKGISYIPLYIGKTTNTKRRISQHILLKEQERIYTQTRQNIKPKPRMTTCQLRTELELVFPEEINPVELIMENVGLSHVTIEGADSISQRFYLEDLAIGLFRPWFNLDSER